MKRDYFILEFIKSGPFLVLIIFVVLILLGVFISNRRKEAVRMKEDVIYIAPAKKN
jgi:hypothetical protein